MLTLRNLIDSMVVCCPCENKNNKKKANILLKGQTCILTPELYNDRENKAAAASNLHLWLGRSLDSEKVCHADAHMPVHQGRHGVCLATAK